MLQPHSHPNLNLQDEKVRVWVTRWGLKPTLGVQLGGIIPESGALHGLASCFLVGAAGPIQCFSSVEYGNINITLVIRTLNTPNMCKVCITILNYNSLEQSFGKTFLSYKFIRCAQLALLYRLSPCLWRTGLGMVASMFMAQELQWMYNYLHPYIDSHGH